MADRVRGLPATFWGMDERAVCEQIGRAVRVIMTFRRHAARDIADVLHLSRGAMDQRLAGQTAFRANELARLAEFLNVHPGVFFEDPDDIVLGTTSRDTNI